MNIEDRELESWKSEWQAETSDSLPSLRKRVRLQTTRMIASNLLGLSIAVALVIYVARIVQRQPDPRTIAFGVASLLSCIATTIFIVWNQIGIWRVEAESTRAYAELLYKRALTKTRRTRFLLVLISVGMTFDCAYLLWADWPVITLQPAAFFTRLARIFVVFLAFFLVIKRYGRRKERQVQEARRFMEELNS